MAKLNNREIKALAANIREELNSIIREKNKKAKEEAEKKFFATAKGKKVKAVLDIDEGLIYSAALNKYLKHETLGTYSPFSNNCTIENMLIIRQIDSKDMTNAVEEIKEELKSKIK